MSDVTIVIIGSISLVGGVILYSVISIKTGYEEDVNENYIPDSFERAYEKIFKKKKE
jgi:hypothetical protein